MRWDGERYQNQDEHEYFLEPTAIYELELSMHLMREELESRLLPEDYAEAMNDPTFIKGWFNSNRIPIDLSDKKIPANQD